MTQCVKHFFSCNIYYGWYFVTRNIYFISVNCYYCFVQWTVCNLSVCRKVNRQYKHNLACAEHDHQLPYRGLHVRWHFTESCKIFTGNATITDVHTDELHVRRHFIESGWNVTITNDFADGLQFVSICRQFTITDKFIDGRCEFQRAGIKCISDHVSLPMKLPTDCEKYGGWLKILLRNSKFTDGFSTYHRWNN
jgi:hypothetical protein